MQTGAGRMDHVESLMKIKIKNRGSTGSQRRTKTRNPRNKSSRDTGKNDRV